MFDDDSQKARGALDLERVFIEGQRQRPAVISMFPYVRLTIVVVVCHRFQASSDGGRVWDILPVVRFRRERVGIVVEPLPQVFPPTVSPSAVGYSDMFLLGVIGPCCLVYRDQG